MIPGLNVKRIVWTIFFLGVTAIAIIAEVVAGVWHPAGTIPWTEYIAQYVPWPVQLIAYVTLAVWLPFHFWRADQKRKKAFTAGLHEGYVHGHKEGSLLVNRSSEELAAELNYRASVSDGG